MNCDKIVEKNLVENIRQEIKIMNMLNGEPHIMPLSKLILTKTDIVMVFPYIPGRDLFRFMRAHKNPKGYLTEYEAQVIFRQLVSALKACHSKGILHRDIKPENIMIDSDLNILLSDFGLAVFMPQSGRHQGRAGTPCYYPYEMVRQ